MWVSANPSSSRYFSYWTVAGSEISYFSLAFWSRLRIFLTSSFLLVSCLMVSLSTFFLLYIYSEDELLLLRLELELDDSLSNAWLEANASFMSYGAKMFPVSSKPIFWRLLPLFEFGLDLCLVSSGFSGHATEVASKVSISFSNAACMAWLYVTFFLMTTVTYDPIKYSSWK